MGPALKDAAARLAEEYDMLPRGSRVLCAVSGGADSMCLLHLLAHWEGVHVVAAHYNHRLRSFAADADESFVADTCRQWGVALIRGEGNVAERARKLGLSTEEAARQMRYEFLGRAANLGSCRRVAIAHNADDNAETILLNLVRGSGLTGLAGIPPVRGRIVRPLLTVTREEILEYLEAYRIPHREDATNGDVRYTRNRLRLQVMPVLRKMNPRAAERMFSAGRQVRAADRFLEEEALRRLESAREEGEGRLSLPLEELEKAPEPVRGRMILCLLDRLGAGRRDVTQAHVEAVLRLTRGERTQLPHRTAAWVENGRLTLERTEPPAPAAALTPGEEVDWGRYRLQLLAQAEGTGVPISIPEGAAVTVGPCPAGERLQLPGSKGRRTVKRLCADAGIDLAQRESLPGIFVDQRLAAVWPLGTDQAFLPEGAPRRFIQITHRDRGDRK